MLSVGFCTNTVPSITILAAGGGVTLDVDRTLVLQMVLFMLLILLLKPLLFDPVLRVFEQREQRTEGARAEARRMEERAGELIRAYERELDRLRQIASEERERLRNETARLEAEIMHEAREVSHRIVSQGRQQIDDKIRAIEADLAGRSDEMGKMIAARVLGREVS